MEIKYHTRVILSKFEADASVVCIDLLLKCNWMIKNKGITYCFVSNLPGQGEKIGEFKHEVRQFQKPYDNQQAEQISLMV